MLREIYRDKCRRATAMARSARLRRLPKGQWQSQSHGLPAGGDASKGSRALAGDCPRGSGKANRNRKRSVAQSKVNRSVV
ncbi:hypothetical protein [Scytonema sp. PCC 10023]|uniref:hypothetical protein n=1 Tax=Scytonema sp. PCC 10023 TaxID=1680591 RepID=UPI0039C72AC5